jgi:hypothetical protein
LNAALISAAVTSVEGVVQCDRITGVAACHDLSVCYS